MKPDATKDCVASQPACLCVPARRQVCDETITAFVASQFICDERTTSGMKPDATKDCKLSWGQVLQ